MCKPVGLKDQNAEVSKEVGEPSFIYGACQQSYTIGQSSGMDGGVLHRGREKYKYMIRSTYL